MKILICDDDIILSEELKTKIENILNEMIPYEKHVVHTFENVFRLYDYLEEKKTITDGIFMDINLADGNETNGIEAAKKIREWIKSVNIIFCTGNIEYVREIFEVNPIYMLLKPIEDNKLREGLEILIEKVNREKNQLVTVKAIRGIYRLIVKDISFAESQGRYVIIHSGRECVTTINKLEIVGKMLGEEFVQCHKSFIVNINKVKRLDGNRLVLFDNTEILVSRQYRQKVKETILNYI